MVALLEAFTPDETDTVAEKRVGGFFLREGDRVGKNSCSTLIVVGKNDPWIYDECRAASSTQKGEERGGSLEIIADGPQADGDGFYFGFGIKTKDQNYDYRIGLVKSTSTGDLSGNEAFLVEDIYSGGGTVIEGYEARQLVINRASLPDDTFTVEISIERNLKGFNFSGWEHHNTYRIRFNIPSQSYNPGSIPIRQNIHTIPNPRPRPPMDINTGLRDPRN